MAPSDAMRVEDAQARQSDDLLPWLELVHAYDAFLVSKPRLVNI